jgi:hypothetical protein
LVGAACGLLRSRARATRDFQKRSIIFSHAWLRSRSISESIEDRGVGWVALVYLSFQLLTIPLTVGGSERFVGVLDGMASVVPLGVSLVAIFGKPELLGTPERWEAAFLLLLIAAIDLFGGYMFNIALSRRTMDVAGPAI